MARRWVRWAASGTESRRPSRAAPGRPSSRCSLRPAIAARFGKCVPPDSGVHLRDNRRQLIDLKIPDGGGDLWSRRSPTGGLTIRPNTCGEPGREICDKAQHSAPLSMNHHGRGSHGPMSRTDFGCTPRRICTGKGRAAVSFPLSAALPKESPTRLGPHQRNPAYVEGHTGKEPGGLPLRELPSFTRFLEPTCAAFALARGPFEVQKKKSFFEQVAKNRA